MPDNVYTQPVSPVDVQWEAEGAASVSNFTRETSTGGTENVAKMSAAAVPVLDAPVVTSARTPWKLETEVGASHSFQGRTVEECLRQLRLNTREMKNIEHYGAEAGTGKTAAVAERNTQAWQKALTEINLEGRNNGIYCPGAAYEFKQIGGGLYGSAILPFETSTPGTRLANVVVAGAPGTQLLVNSNANPALPLFYGTQTGGLFFLDLQLQHLNAAAGVLLYLDPQTAGIINNIHVDRCTFQYGNSHLRIDYTSGANYVKNLWVTNCSFGNAVAPGVLTSDVSGAHIIGNTFDGTNAGINMSALGTKLENYIVAENFLVNGATNQDISIYPTGGFSGVAGNFKVRDNTIAFGDINVVNSNQWEIYKNTMSNGGVQISYDVAAAAYSWKIAENTIVNGITGTSAGIFVGCVSTNCRRWYITNNDIYNAATEGINLSLNGSARMIGGEVSGNMILAYNAAGGGSNAAIQVGNAAVATAGVQDSIFAMNRCTAAVAGNRPTYAITEDAGAQNARNHFLFNMVKGYVTGPIIMGGTNSQDRVWNTGVGTGQPTTIDLGAAV